MNLPNKLTIARCIMTFFFVALMSFEAWWTFTLGTALFIAAAITDHYDGKIARARNLVTNFGKLMDPVADKVLVVSAFILFMRIKGLWIPGWTIIIILAREFLVTGARSLVAAEGQVIAASIWGKLKTICQLTYCITFLILATLLQIMQDFPMIWTHLPGEPKTYIMVMEYASLVGIILVAMITLYSGAQFAAANWKALKLDNLS